MRSPLYLTLAALFIVGVTGCGSVSLPSTSQEATDPSARCFLEQGLREARRSSDLAFFVRADARKSVNTTGFAQNERFLIQEYKAAGRESPMGGPAWILYTGQPRDGGLTPLQVVGHPAAGSYVLFAVNPGPRRTRGANNCFRQIIGLGRR